jgi:hypothetical protein
MEREQRLIGATDFVRGHRRQSSLLFGSSHLTEDKFFFFVRFVGT